MQLPRPADELHEIRSEIAKLQAREKTLVQAFLRDPVAGTMGRFVKVEVIEAQKTVFDPTLLPDNLRQNPNFYREITQQNVQTLPLPSALSPRPGWPQVAASHSPATRATRARRSPPSTAPRRDRARRASRPGRRASTGTGARSRAAHGQTHQGRPDAVRRRSARARRRYGARSPARPERTG